MTDNTSWKNRIMEMARGYQGAAVLQLVEVVAGGEERFRVRDEARPFLLAAGAETMTSILGHEECLAPQQQVDGRAQPDHHNHQVKGRTPLNRHLDAFLAAVFLLLSCLTTHALAEDDSPPHAAWPQLFRPLQVNTSGARLLTVYQNELVASHLEGLDESLGIHEIGRWDGSRWRPMGDLGQRLQIRAMAEYQGRLVVGGGCACDDCDRAPLAVWDGREWTLFGQEIQGWVGALVVWNDLLVIGGEFRMEGRADVSNLVAWDGKSWVFLPTGGLGGGKNTIRALADHDGELHVGGLFPEVEGVATVNVARWDGKRWHGLDGGVDGLVTYLSSYKGQMYAAGEFDLAGGEVQPALARWDGQGWSDVGGAFREAGDPRHLRRLKSMKVIGDRLWVCGDFCGLGGAPADAVACWDGKQWHQAAGPLGAGEGDWFQKKLKKGLAYPVVFAVEVFQGQVVVNAPDARAFPIDRHGGYLWGLIKWTGDRWQGLEWPHPGFRNLYCKIREYKGEIIAGSRFQNSPHPLEVWRGGKWVPLVSFPDDPAAESLTVRQIEVMGDDIYVFAQWQAEEKSSLVFHFDGEKIEQLGPALPHLMGRQSRLGRAGDRLVLMGNKVVPGGRSLEPLVTVLEWTGGEWQEAQGTPELTGVSDVLSTSQGLFVASMTEVREEGRQRARPAIWLVDGEDWRQTWSHDSGMIPFLQEDGGVIRAGLSQAVLDADPPAPLLQWDGHDWRGVGVPLAGFGWSGETAQIHALALYRGRLLLSCTVGNAGKGLVSVPVVVSWDGRAWQEYPDLDIPVGGMLVQEDRLWISEGRGDGINPLPLTWYEGDLAAARPLEVGSVESWREWTRKKEQEEAGNAQQSGWEWAPPALSLPGVPDAPEPAPSHDIQDDYFKRVVGWYGQLFQGTRVDGGELEAVPSGSLTAHLRRYQTLGVNLPVEDGARYRVAFDFRVERDGRPWRKGMKSPLQVAVRSLRGRKGFDRVTTALEPQKITLGADGRARISLMVTAPPDSAVLSLDFRRSSRDYAVDVVVEHLEIETTTMPLVQGYDQLTDFLTSRYRDYQGRTVPDDSLDAQLRTRAADAPGTLDLVRIMGMQIQDLRKRGLMHDLDPALEELGRDQDLRLGEYWAGIDSVLVNPYGNTTRVGFLPGKTVYMRKMGGRNWEAFLAESGPLALSGFDADTRLILDLRLNASSMTQVKGGWAHDEAVRWRRALELGAYLGGRPRVVCSFRGEESLLDQADLAPHVGEADGDGWRPLMVRPDSATAVPREIVVLMNEGTEIPAVLALKDVPGVTLVGRAARRLPRPRTELTLPSGTRYYLPTGEMRTAEGKNPLAEGVAPHILIADDPHEDAAFAKALEVLNITLNR